MNRLIVYLLCALGLLLAAFVAFRVVGRRAYLTRRRLTVFPFLLQILICALYYNFPYLYLPVTWADLPTLPESWLLRIPGLSLVFVGVAVTLAGMATLGFRRVFGLGSPALYQGGLYGICRNPQIVALFFCTLGFALLWPSWYALGWVLLYLPIFHMMVLTEEAYLQQQHGEVFRHYCQQVPRYVRLRRSAA